MRNVTVIFTLGLLAVGLLASGCGGGSESSQLTKADFVEQADVICEQAIGKLRAEMTLFAKKETNTRQPQALAGLVKSSMIPALQSESTEIRALGKPAEGAKEVAAFLKAMQAAIGKAEAHPATFLSSVDPLEAAEVAATRYGLSACPVSALPAS